MNRCNYTITIIVIVPIIHTPYLYTVGCYINTIYNMQYEKGCFHYCKIFLYTLDFVSLLWKTVYDTSVFEGSHNILCLYIVNSIKILLLFYLFD